MTNGKHAGVLREASRSGKIDQDVTNDLLFSGLVEVWEVQDEIRDGMKNNAIAVAKNTKSIEFNQWLIRLVSAAIILEALSHML